MKSLVVVLSLLAACSCKKQTTTPINKASHEKAAQPSGTQPSPAKQLVPPSALWKPYGSRGPLDIDGRLVAYGEVLEPTRRCVTVAYVPKRQTAAGVQQETKRLHQQIVAAGYKREAAGSANDLKGETTLFRKGRRFFEAIPLDTDIDLLDNSVLQAPVLSYSFCVEWPRSDKRAIRQVREQMRKRMAPFLRKWFGSNRYAQTWPNRVTYQKQTPCSDESQKMIGRWVSAEYDCADSRPSGRIVGSSLSCSKASAHEHYTSYTRSRDQDENWIFKIGRSFDDQWDIEWTFHPAPGSNGHSEKMHHAELMASWSKETAVPSSCPGLSGARRTLKPRPPAKRLEENGSGRSSRAWRASV